MRLDLRCQKCDADFWVKKPVSDKTRCSICHSRCWDGRWSHLGRTIAEKFWEKVEKTDGCWRWIGSKVANGYGQVSTKNIPEHVHRISWKINRGPIPEGIHVLHHCDNPECSNPDHLFLGTNAGNIADRVSKGRSHRALAKLKPEHIPQIRKMREEGMLLREIGSEFNVSYVTIGDIISGLSWRDF